MQRVAAGLVVALAALGAVSLYGARGARPPRPRVPPRASARAVRVRRAVGRRARPPQFVVVSFDGSGGAPLWSYWRSVAKRVHAHFTFFVSGVYLVDWAHHDEYAPPRGPRGESAIGFAPDEAWIRAMRRQMALGYLDGDEIGTHFNGHFCGPGGVDTWNAADWTSELAQYDAFLFSPRTHLPFGRSEIVGGRTPCLEGKLSVVDPVLAAHGFRYDASRQALLGTWPTRVHGLWSFPLLEVPFIGHTFRVTSMDYNFMANQIDESPARIENETERTLLNAFRAEYLGRRAPLSFGWHFETWESRAYVRALTRVLGRVCRLPEVRCVSYRELADWLDATPRRVLARYRTGRFPRMNRA